MIDPYMQATADLEATLQGFANPRPSPFWTYGQPQQQPGVFDAPRPSPFWTYGQQPQEDEQQKLSSALAATSQEAPINYLGSMATGGEADGSSPDASSPMAQKAKSRAGLANAFEGGIAGAGAGALGGPPGMIIGGGFGFLKGLVGG